MFLVNVTQWVRWLTLGLFPWNPHWVCPKHSVVVKKIWAPSSFLLLLDCEWDHFPDYLEGIHSATGSQLFRDQRKVIGNAVCQDLLPHSFLFTPRSWKMKTVKEKNTVKLQKQKRIYSQYITQNVCDEWLYNPFLYRGMFCNISNRSVTWYVNNFPYQVSEGANIQTLGWWTHATLPHTSTTKEFLCLQ